MTSLPPIVRLRQHLSAPHQHRAYGYLPLLRRQPRLRLGKLHHPLVHIRHRPCLHEKSRKQSLVCGSCSFDRQGCSVAAMSVAVPTVASAKSVAVLTAPSAFSPKSRTRMFSSFTALSSLPLAAKTHQ